MTTASLRSYSHKDLAQMARQGGVPGWHSMRKDQLVKALLVAARSKAPKLRAPKKNAAPARRSVSLLAGPGSVSIRRVPRSGRHARNAGRVVPQAWAPPP